MGSATDSTATGNWSIPIKFRNVVVTSPRSVTRIALASASILALAGSPLADNHLPAACLA
jgi:hypothetical protein